mmetsp:Transcript_97247/g.253421  ORF Transcript_97247/g.253421 Transcript_97247/m.253421 type:complete len:84 (-) Transcript_97247:392-643(-)
MHWVSVVDFTSIVVQVAVLYRLFQSTCFITTPYLMEKLFRDFIVLGTQSGIFSSRQTAKGHWILQFGTRSLHQFKSLLLCTRP